MEVFFPCPSLSAFVQQYLVIESRDGVANRLLPDTTPVLSIRLKGQVRLTAGGAAVDLSSLTLSGLRKTSRIATYEKDSATLLVLFRAGGSAAFFKEPLQELFEAHVSLDLLEGHGALSQLSEQLAMASGRVQQVNLVERFLQNRLQLVKTDQLIQESIRRIQEQQGLVKIRELARSLYISQDAFEKRFRRVAGVTPKQFAFITKMRTIVSRARQEATLADLAFDAGYYDLPHFNKDFKLFTGQTPTAFRKSPVIM